MQVQAMCMAGFRNFWRPHGVAPWRSPSRNSKGAGSLPADFSAVDALGRGYRVLILAAGSDAIDVLAAESGRSPAIRSPPSAALLEAAGEARLGLVAPDAPSRLAGPTIDYDVSAFQAAFAGAPAVGALAALRRFDHQAVYGGRLQRLAVPGFPDANRMETDLDMGGNAITGAGQALRCKPRVERRSGSGRRYCRYRRSDGRTGRAGRRDGRGRWARSVPIPLPSRGVVSSGSLTVNGALRAASISSTGRR